MFDKSESGLYFPVSYDDKSRQRRIAKYKAGLDVLTASSPISDAEMMTAMFQYMHELCAVACKTEKQVAEFDKSVDDCIALMRKKRAKEKS